MNVFLGSANEETELVDAIARQIAQKGWKAVRWKDAMQPGLTYLENLERLAPKVDAAVLIFAPTDMTVAAGTERATPRDNVVFEAGLFMARCGSQRTLLVGPTAKGAVHVPSNLDGMVLVPLHDHDHDATALAVVKRLGASMSQPTTQDHIKVIASPKVVESLLQDAVDPSWIQRALYIGSDGARAWLKVSTDSNYLPAPMKQRMKDALRDTAQHATGARIFVSLGPGDARSDIVPVDRLMQLAGNVKGAIKYIPVDISDALLQRSYHLLRAHGIHVPFGILADFEQQMDFIARQVSIRLAGTKVVSILGNTFGNLDLLENHFVQGLMNNGLLAIGDYLLLEVALTGGGRNDAREEDTRISEGRRRFLAHGIARRTNVSEEEIYRGFEERIRTRVGSSDVKDTTALEYYDRVADKVAITARRYDWDALLSWLSGQSLKVVAKEIAAYENYPVRMGSILAKREQ